MFLRGSIRTKSLSHCIHIEGYTASCCFCNKYFEVKYGPTREGHGAFIKPHLVLVGESHLEMCIVRMGIEPVPEKSTLGYPIIQEGYTISEGYQQGILTTSDFSTWTTSGTTGQISNTPIGGSYQLPLNFIVTPTVPEDTIVIAGADPSISGLITNIGITSIPEAPDMIQNFTFTFDTNNTT